MQSKSETIKALANEQLQIFAFLLGDEKRALSSYSLFNTEQLDLKLIFSELFA